MVRRIRALLGFANTRDSELLVFGQNVLERLFGNPAYPKPPLKKETFKTLLDSYGAAITAALDGSKQAIAERNGLRAEVIAALRQLGHYAQYTCNDDMPTFISSGFQPAFVARATSQPLAQPFISNINHGKSGELFVEITPVQKARNYQLRYGTQGPDGMEPNSWTIRTVPCEISNIRGRSDSWQSVCLSSARLRQARLYRLEQLGVPFLRVNVTFAERSGPVNH